MSMNVDAHVHIWDMWHPPHADHPLPPHAGSPTDLLPRMDAAGIDKALIVQPVNYQFDHTYILSAVAASPTRFAAIALADTTGNTETACQKLRTLVQEHGVIGVRINPRLAPGGLLTPVVSALLEEAARLRVPVCLFAMADALEDVESLLRMHVDTDMVLDHFAFCSPGEHADALKHLLRLGEEFPRLYVKVSAWFRVSAQEWPHADMFPTVRALLDAFGKERLLFGSDFPFVTGVYEYTKACAVLREAGLSSEETHWLAGASAAKLYKLS